MRTKIIILLSIFIMLAGHPCLTFASDDVETDPLVLKKLEQFQDMKFGLFIHWGIYSQWGCGASWPLVKEAIWDRPDELKSWRPSQFYCSDLENPSFSNVYSVLY